MNRKIVIAGVTVVVLAIPVTLLLRCPSVVSQSEGPRASSDEVAKVHEEMADLRDRVEASNRVAASVVRAAMASQAARMELAEAAPEVGQQAPVEPAPGRNAVSDEELRVRLNGRFSSESPDPVWSRMALTLLDEHIHARLPDGSRVKSIECHRTMCRVEAQHSSLSVYTSFVNNALLFPEGGWSGPVMTQIVNPGVEQVTSMAYLLREGQDFATIAEQ